MVIKTDFTVNRSVHFPRPGEHCTIKEIQNCGCACCKFSNWECAESTTEICGVQRDGDLMNKAQAWCLDIKDLLART